MLRSVGFYIAIALGLLLAVLTANPVRVQPANAPPTAFSAERAMADVALIARAPHPIGSAENARVREALIGRLRSLGFTVETYAATVALPGPIIDAGRPQTLVAVRAGSDRRLPPAAIMSHYDSVPGSPGAADDAAGVAASLEVARAIAARGPASRDLVLIMTDGEEAGLLGAEAFFTRHPLARRLGAVVNLEARGSSGPALMFETSADNGGLIRLYAAAAPLPAANSLLGWVYDRMPNGSDFTPAKRAGLAGLNFAFLGRPFDYHSASATPANLDRRSLQSMGDQTLGVMARLVGPNPLPERAPNLVYADLFGLGLVAYPAWGGWLLLAASAGLLAVGWRRLGRWRPAAPELLRGAGGLVLVLVATTLAVRVLGGLAPAGETFYQGRPAAAFGLYLAAMALMTGSFVVALTDSLVRGRGRWRTVVVLAVLALASCLHRGFDVVALGLALAGILAAVLLLGRASSAKGLWGGALALTLVLALGLQLTAPPLAFLLQWPLLAGAALAAATGLGTAPARAATLALIATGAVVFAFLARLASLAFDGLGLSQPEVLAVFATLSLLALAPLATAAATRLSGRILAGLAAAAAVILTLYVALHDPASPRTPEPSHVLHVTDLARGRSLRTTLLEQPGAWTLAAVGQPRRRENLPALFLHDVLVAPAPAVVPAPALAVTPIRDGPRVGLFVLAPGAREARFSLRAPLTGLAVDGVPAPARADAEGWVRLRFHAPADGFRLTFDPPAGGALDWRLAAVGDGWPAGAEPLPRRPVGVMPWLGSDSGVVVTEGRVRW